MVLTTLDHLHLASQTVRGAQSRDIVLVGE